MTCDSGIVGASNFGFNGSKSHYLIIIRYSYFRCVSGIALQSCRPHSITELFGLQDCLLTVRALMRVPQRAPIKWQDPRVCFAINMRPFVQLRRVQLWPVCCGIPK